MLPRLLQENFSWVQIALGGLFAVMAWLFFRPKSPESGFKLREADRLAGNKTDSHQHGARDMADDRIRQTDPLALPGFRAEGAAHEILGVSATASAAEIQRAYRDLMKRYHPDRVGKPGSREWRDAQQIAHAINRAKDEMLSKR